MKSRSSCSAVLFTFAVLVACLGIGSQNRAEASPHGAQPAKASAASQPPAYETQAVPAGAVESLHGASFSPLAWEIFVAVMAPGADGSLVIESWTEECQLAPDMAGCPSAASVEAAKAGNGGKPRLLHAGATGHLRKMPGTDCGPMRTTRIEGYRAPSNLAKDALYCEEVYVSPPEVNFVKTVGLTTLVGQRAYGQEHTRAINFPGTGLHELRSELDAVEVKLNWAPASSFSAPAFACPDPTHKLYTQTINGICYALVGVHVTSKVMPTWLWATFEPNNKVTNPNRCDAKLYGACFDPWGTTSAQPYGKGTAVHQSEPLRQAMATAHMHPAFRNYFLTGVQANFVDGRGKPTQLGNSFIEFNQGVGPGKSSCITCHQYAHFDGKQSALGRPEHNFGKVPDGWPSIGYACNKNQKENCFPEDAVSILQDFSWMLGKMPYRGGDAKSTADK